jgi:hypothetical protein
MQYHLLEGLLALSILVHLLSVSLSSSVFIQTYMGDNTRWTASWYRNHIPSPDYQCCGSAS